MSEENKKIEINKLIHEKVFGAKWYQYTEKSLIEAPWNRGEKRLIVPEHVQGIVQMGVIEEATTANSEVGLDDLPNYSGSIADAFKVVNEMEKRGFNDWTVGGYGSERVGYGAWFHKDGLEYEAIAETPELAICRAALSALGVEI